MHLQLSAAAILGVAGSIYGVLQAAKKAGLDGYISGRLGLAFAVAFAFVSTIALAGNLSANTLCTALAVALAASGLHAGVKVASTGTLGALSPNLSSKAAAKLGALLIVCALPIGLSSCNAGAALGVPAPEQNIELAANLTDSVAHGLKLAQDSIRTLHQAGRVSDGEAAAINAWLKAAAAKNDIAVMAIDAAEGGAASEDSWRSAVRAVAAAVASLPPSEFGISSASAKQEFTVAAATLEAAAAAVNANFGQ